VKVNSSPLGQDSLLDLLPDVATSSLPECENTVSCVAARLRRSSLLLDHITVVGKTLSRVNQLSENPESWEYEDNNGTSAVLTWTGDEMYGHINAYGQGNMFVIESTKTDKMLVLKEMDTSTWAEDDDDDQEVEMRDAIAAAPHLVEQGLADRTNRIATITVTVYVTRTLKRAVRNLELFIQQVIDETNQGYINSGALIRIALHCILLTDIADGQSDSDTLKQLEALGSYRDNYNGVRKSADTAILLVKQFKRPTACGLNNFDSFRYGRTLGVVKKSCALGYYSFGHEVAHGMGLTHNREQAVKESRGKYKYPSSPPGYHYGKVFAPGKYRSIMGYNLKGESRVNYYSSPNVMFRDKYRSYRTGSNKEDNLRVLNENRWAVADIGDESMPCTGGTSTGSGCRYEDKTTYCSSMDKYYCTRGSYVDWMNKNCAKTCKC